MVRKWKNSFDLYVALSVVLVLLCGNVWGQDAEVLYLGEVGDLDLSGNIVYAVNCGNNGNPAVGEVTFTPHRNTNGLTISASQLAEDAVASWWGPSPSTGNAGLNQLLYSAVATWTDPLEIRIDAEGLIAGKSYLLQLMSYEPESHGRNIDIIVEDEEIVTGFSPIAVQGGVVGQGGCLIKYEFVASDSVMNVLMVNHENACGLCGLILTEITGPLSFADYGSGTTTELVSGKGTWQINWGQGPWTWSDSGDAPLLDSNVSSVLDLHATAPADLSPELLATLPIAGTLTLSASDPSLGGATIGTMTMSGTGFNIIEGNASRVLVDEGSGMFLAPFSPPGPELTLMLEETTGVFAYIEQASDWRLRLAGLYAAPLMKDVGLQDNIMAALGGQLPLVGGLGQFELAGECDTDESKRPQRFCEYGTGIAAQFGAGGALWEQVWAGGPWPWQECAAELNAQFLGDSVSGQLETTTAGVPSIDENMVLSFDFAGLMTLASQSAGNRSGSDGQILGDVNGTFVADVNADHAVLDADGNIVIAFGTSVHDSPDALITVTEATGKYADIQQAGQWAWYVNGVLAITRLPDLSIQDNIMAALQNNDLILHAEEEFVLTGWYYRDSQEQ